MQDIFSYMLVIAFRFLFIHEFSVSIWSVNIHTLKHDFISRKADTATGTFPIKLSTSIQ